MSKTMEPIATRTIMCTNVPPSLLVKNEAKKYFQEFGNIVKLLIKSKSMKIFVDYDTTESAEKAILEGGEHHGNEFQIAFFKRSPRKKAVKKDADPDWRVDPDVQAELASMGGIMSKKYNLRPELMNVDSDSMHTPLKSERVKQRTEQPKSKSDKHSSGYSNTQKDLINIIKQPAFTIEEKFRALDARDKLIRLRRKTKKTINLEEIRHNVGICSDMCPEKERLMREMQHQVAVYEQEIGDRSMNHTKAVKQYSRSSADQESPLPHDLRNVDVLQMTMSYLTHKIINLCDSPDVNLAEWFHFLWDRTRGIRKDITQQELCCPGSVALVEQCARFHIHCSARLVAEDPSVFDQKINTENLTKCLQTLKYMYHDLELKGIVCPREAEFRAYIILLNLNDGNFMWEVQQLRGDIQRSNEIKFALDVYSSLDKNNFVKFFKLVRSTTYLNACILLRYFIQVRVKALKTMASCYTPRLPHATFPISELNRMLAFEGPASTIDFLEYYGFTVSDDRNYFTLNKRDFQLPNMAYTLDRAVNVIEIKKTQSVGEVIYGQSLPDATFERHIPKNSFDHKGFLDVSEFPELAHLEIDANTTKDMMPTLSERSSSPVVSDGLKEPREPKEQSQNKSSVNVFASIAQNVFGAPVVQQSAFNKVDSAPKIGGFSWSLNQNSQKKEDPSVSNQKSLQIQENQRKQMQELQELQRKKLELQEKLMVEEKRLAEEKKKEMEAKQYELQKRMEMERLHLQEKQRQRQKELEEQQRRKEEEQQKQRQKELEKQRQKELETQRKLQEIRQQEAEEAFNRKRKQEEELRKQKEILRIEKELEENKRRDREIEISVKTLMDDMLGKVEHTYKIHRLQELKDNYLSRLVIMKWKRKVFVNKRKRKAIDQTPLWFGRFDTKEIARELYTSNQNLTLNMMKRYKSGVSEIQISPIKTKINKVNIQALCGKNLLRNSIESKRLSREIFFRIVLHTNISDNVYSSLIENVLNDYLCWNKNRKNFLEQFNENNSQFIYSIEATTLLKQDDSNGIVIIADDLSDELITKLFNYLNGLGDDDFIPIYFIIQSGDDHPAIPQLLENGLVSKVHVSKIYFNRESLHETLNDALGYLSSNYQLSNDLFLNTLKAFLMDNIGIELWQRIRSFTKWNFAYKKCLCKPNIVISLYNEAVDRLKEIVFNDRCFGYANFPKIFQDFIGNKIPDYLPCDYKYFPSFWKDSNYKSCVINQLTRLRLPQFNDNWPPKDQQQLETIIYSYCKRVFPDDCKKVFYRIMAQLLKNLDLDFVNWVDVIETLSQEIMLNKLDYELGDCFKGKTIFNQLFVVYEKHVLDEFAKDSWFYLKNSVIEKEIDLELCQRDRGESEEPLVYEEPGDFDLNATIEKVFQADSPNVSTKKEEFDNFKELLDDLEESVNIQKEISRRFQSALNNVLNDV